MTAFLKEIHFDKKLAVSNNKEFWHIMTIAFAMGDKDKCKVILFKSVHSGLE